MKRIAYRADAQLIERARVAAHNQNKSLNEAFREWLEQYAGQGKGQALALLMRRLKHAKSTRPLSRNKMNER